MAFQLRGNRTGLIRATMRWGRRPLRPTTMGLHLDSLVAR